MNFTKKRKDENEYLHKHFKRAKFKPFQQKAINAFLDGKNPFVILPTGTGKTLCYQLPAKMMSPGLSIVVTPLISLMEDQVNSAKGVKTAYINSDQTKEEKDKVLEDIIDEKVELLYVSPERLSSQIFIDTLNKREVDLFAIDEAHCISVWGHDFRPSYLFLPDAIKQLGNPKLALFTATATPQTIEDVTKVLELENYELIQGEKLRGNIKYDVFKSEDKLNDLKKILWDNRFKEGSTIIYAPTIGDIYKIQEGISRIFDATIYHGQMDSTQKRENQEKFMSNKTKIMVATNAFGMGIDKPDIYTIVHSALPSSLENYIQESGRAGRDGSPSESILLYHPLDLSVQFHFLANSNPSAKVIKGVYEQAFKIAKKVRDYQQKPISYIQLKHFFNKLEQEKWAKNRTNSALGILINMGFIEKNGEEIDFTEGPKIEFDEKAKELLKEKELQNHRRLQMMNLYAQSKGDYVQTIENYLEGATVELIESTENPIETVRNSVLGFIGNHKQPKGKLCNILTGTEKNVPKELSQYHRSLPFLSGRYISETIDNLAFEGHIEEVEVGAGLQYVLTNKGMEFLDQKGISIKEKPPIEDDIHDNRNREMLKETIQKWYDKDNTQYNESLGHWMESFNSFTEIVFEANGKMYDGLDIITSHSGLEDATYRAFRQIMKFFLNETIPQEFPQTKRKKIDSIQ